MSLDSNLWIEWLDRIGFFDSTQNRSHGEVSGFRASVEWLSKTKSHAKIIRWLMQTITEDNILTSKHLETYNSATCSQEKPFKAECGNIAAKNNQDSERLEYQLGVLKKIQQKSESELQSLIQKREIIKEQVFYRELKYKKTLRETYDLFVSVSKVVKAFESNARDQKFLRSQKEQFYKLKEHIESNVYEMPNFHTAETNPIVDKLSFILERLCALVDNSMEELTWEALKQDQRNDGEYLHTMLDSVPVVKKHIVFSIKEKQQEIHIHERNLKAHLKLFVERMEKHRMFQLYLVQVLLVSNLEEKNVTCGILPQILSSLHRILDTVKETQDKRRDLKTLFRSCEDSIKCISERHRGEVGSRGVHSDILDKSRSILTQVKKVNSHLKKYESDMERCIEKICPKNLIELQHSVVLKCKEVQNFIKFSERTKS